MSILKSRHEYNEDDDEDIDLILLCCLAILGEDIYTFSSNTIVTEIDLYECLHEIQKIDLIEIKLLNLNLIFFRLYKV